MTCHRRRVGSAAMPAILWIAGIGPALAHGADSSIVLLLPTAYYLFGATFAVAASFLLVSALPAQSARRLFPCSIRLGSYRAIPAAVPSFAAFLLMLLLLSTGIWGSRDPLHNPLPAMVWTVWWVCLTIAHGFVGPLWQCLNPWTGPIALLRRLGGRDFGRVALIELPLWLGYGLAIVQFFGFAWFELVDLAPSDPRRLAAAIGLYWSFNAAGMVIAGEQAWTERAEPFSIFFRLIARLAFLHWRQDTDGRVALSLVWPGSSLVHAPVLPISGVLFVLLTLSTVSFDGLARTFAWLGAIGVNPLDFQGRSTVVVSSTFGLVASFAGLSALFFGSLSLGLLLAGGGSLRAAGGRLIYSIIPISVAFQVAHYLTMVLIELQNLLIGITDPYELGWDLIGAADYHVTTSFLYTFEGVRAIFLIETLAIGLGHVVAVIVAHAIVAEMSQTRWRGFLGELPFACLMVFYTAFGLWLLSTARI